MTFSTGFVLVLAMAGGQSNGTPPRTVESVDLRAYAGTYYEIARFPNRFQTQCAGDVTATYALRADGRIDVINRCRTSAGTMTEARGIAKRADQDASGAKLKVRFAPAILSFIPSVWGDYWILGLAEDYSWAVVGSPDRNYLWILARTAMLDTRSFDTAVAVAAANSFDVSRLVRTNHAAP